MESTTSGPGLTIFDYVMVVRRRPWTIVIPFFAAIVIGVAASLRITPQFESVATLEVSDNTELSDLFAGVAGKGSFSSKALVKTVGQNIKRQSFLEPILLRNRITEGFDINTLRGMAALYNEHVFKRLEVKHTTSLQGPDVISISYRGRGAAQVARFVTDVRDSYIESKLEEQREFLRDLRNRFRLGREDAERNLRRTDDLYERFRRENEKDFFIVQRKLSVSTYRELEEVRKRLADNRLALRTAKAEYDRQVEATRRIPEQMDGEVQRRENPEYLEAEKRLREKRAELDKLLNQEPRRQPTSKIVVDLKEEITRLETAFEALQPATTTELSSTLNPAWVDADRERARLEVQVATLSEVIKQDETKEVELAQRSEKLPELERRLTQLEEERDSARIRRDEQAELEKRANDWLDTLNSKAGSAFRPLETPLPERAAIADPVWPNVPIIVALSAMIGLGLGIAVAFAVELLSGAFLTSGQVGRVLPVQVLGGISIIPTPMTAARRRRNTILLALASIAFFLLVYVHVCYFVDTLQSLLPVAVFELLQSVYRAT